MEQDIKLRDDYLDRGEYALTLFRIIADYAPKNLYDVIDEEDIGDIYEGEIQYAKDDRKPEEHIENIGNPLLPAREPEPRQDPEYTIKLKHLDNEAFIMAISGAWGSGKTTFMKMFFDLLHGEGYQVNENEKAVDFIEDNKYQKGEVAYFDAWKNDFYDDPIVPFAKMLLKTLIKSPDDYAEKAETVWETYRSMLEAKKDGLATLKNTTSIEERIQEVKGFLREAVQPLSQRKVIVIIDELDRCKPTFAIQLLEIVKHLFNVRGIVFLFALDISQLQHCVKTVYGKDFDAIGYLERFFDYYSLLPKGSDDLLFQKIAQEYEIQDNMDDYHAMCRQFDLTPREMKGICSSFYYLNKYQLKGYPEKAKLLCFYLLLLKHNYPERIHALSAGDAEAREEFFKDKIPQCLKSISTVSDEPFYKALVDNKAIKDTEFAYMTKDGACGEPMKYDINNPLKNTDKGSLSFIVYAKDYKKDIGNKHVLEYLFTKVESYGRDMPMEVKKDVIKRGTVMTFGRWHKNSENDMEPIEWIVLEREGNRVLIISRYAIDSKPYHEEWENITWEGCTLRKWLNTGFLEGAFTKVEKERIVEKEVKNEDNPKYGTHGGKATRDRVFLLSMQEAGMYFGSEEKRMCKATGHTLSGIKRAYEKQGWDDFEKYYGNDPRCAWWLRSPGSNGLDAAVVHCVGVFSAGGGRVDSDRVGVRPALWLILNP